MSTINLSLPDGVSISDGKQITFKAPCNCSDVTGVIIEGVTYTLVDATNTSLSEYSNSFKEGALISVIIDTTSNKAYILNSGSVQRSTDGSIDMDSKSIKNLADPVNDTDAVNKKYVDDSSSYKLGDILTTVRTDLDETWALCNGDYVDESQPIYDILPEIQYSSTDSWYKLRGISLRYNVIKVLTPYYILNRSPSSYYITTDLLSDSYTELTKCNSSILKYKGDYLYFPSADSSSIITEFKVNKINLLTSEISEYLSITIKSTPYVSNRVFSSFNDTILIFSSNTIKNDSNFSYELDDINHVLLINTSYFVMYNTIYAVTYEKVDTKNYTMHIYKYINNTFVSDSSITGLSGEYNSIDLIQYVGGIYYVVFRSSNLTLSVYKYTGLSWYYIGDRVFSSISYNTISVLGILGNSLILYAYRESGTNTAAVYKTLMIPLDDLDTTEDLFDSTYINYLTYSSDNRVFTTMNSNDIGNNDENYMICSTVSQGKMLPIIAASYHSSEYNYIKVGGNS